MTKTLKITDALETIVVDLWGHRYRSKLVTKTGEVELERLQEAFDEIDTDDEDSEVQLVRLYGEMVAATTEPIGDAPEDVAALVAEKYEADELSFANLMAIALKLRDATQNPFAGARS